MGLWMRTGLPQDNLLKACLHKKVYLKDILHYVRVYYFSNRQLNMSRTSAMHGKTPHQKKGFTKIGKSTGSL